MTPNVQPAAIRAQALAHVARGLARTPSQEDRLAAFAGWAVAAVLVDLEAAFDIGIDVDEVLPDGRVRDLLDLVARRARGRRIGPPARRAAAQACRVYDLADERARRARPSRMQVA